MKNYMCIILVLSILMLVKSQSLPDQKKFYEECKKEIGLSDSKVPLSDDQTEANCLYACMSEKYGSLVDGKLVTDKEIEFIANHTFGGVSDIIKANINECVNKANEEKDKFKVRGVYKTCTADFDRRRREEKDKETEQYSIECEKEIGATRESLKDLEEDDPKHWCILACVMKKRGGIVNGKAVVEKVIELLPTDMFLESKASFKARIAECVNEANKSEDQCQVFMVVRKCLIEKYVVD